MFKKIVVTAGVMFCSSTWAATPIPSVEGVTFALTGTYKPKVSVSCKIGGSRTVRTPGAQDLPAEIQFLPEGAFKWSDSGFSVAAKTDVSGDWSQKNKGKISLTFDDDQYSAIRSLGSYFKDIYGSAGGGNYQATFSTTAYSFSAKVDKNMKLTVTEKGGFKVKATASYAGSSNTCTYKYTLTRTYVGNPK